VGEAIGKSKPLEYSLGAPFRLDRVHASDAQGHFRVFKRREFREEMMKLKNEPNVLVPKSRQRVVRHRPEVGVPNKHRARIAAIEAAKQMEQRALSNTGRADDRHHLARLDREIEVAEHVQALGSDVVALVNLAGG